MILRIRLWFSRNVSVHWLTFLAARLLIACLILIVHSSHASALVDRTKAADTTCRLAELNFDPAVDVHALKNFKMAVAVVLKQEKFDELDCTAEQLRSSKARFAGGMWQLQAFYRGLDDPLVGSSMNVWRRPRRRWTRLQLWTRSVRNGMWRWRQ